VTSGPTAGEAFARLVDVMRVLRSRHGCPWDREQTHETLRPYLLEEAYELLDAIQAGNDAEVAGELGDVLLQVVFHAQIASESRRFDIVSVIERIVNKLVHRHPHVFTATGDPLTPAGRRRLRLDTAGEVKTQWERLKAKERPTAGRDAGVLTGVPRALPALLRATRIGNRAAMVGFDWPAAEGVLDKIDEEVRELRAAVDAGPAKLRDEMGDVLFSIANLARKLQIDPELALTEASDKFTTRFGLLEAHLARHGLTVHTATAEQMASAWDIIKKTSTRNGRARSDRTRSARGSRDRRSRP
jgi:MazG family protein